MERNINQSGCAQCGLEGKRLSRPQERVEVLCVVHLVGW